MLCVAVGRELLLGGRGGPLIKGQLCPEEEAIMPGRKKPAGPQETQSLSIRKIIFTFFMRFPYRI